MDLNIETKVSVGGIIGPTWLEHVIWANSAMIKFSTTKPCHVTISVQCQDNAMTRFTGARPSVSQSVSQSVSLINPD